MIAGKPVLEAFAVTRFTGTGVVSLGSAWRFCQYMTAAPPAAALSTPITIGTTHRDENDELIG
jgi:hypothetical protein